MIKRWRRRLKKRNIRKENKNKGKDAGIGKRKLIINQKQIK